jgi:hypothetical protein
VFIKHTWTDPRCVQQYDTDIELCCWSSRLFVKGSDICLKEMAFLPAVLPSCHIRHTRWNQTSTTHTEAPGVRLSSNNGCVGNIHSLKHKLMLARYWIAAEKEKWPVTEIQLRRPETSNEMTCCFGKQNRWNWRNWDSSVQSGNVNKRFCFVYVVAWWLK